MPPTTEREEGYNEAANDFATALTELRRQHGIPNGIPLPECVDIIHIVARFKELRAIRFGYEKDIR